MLSHLRSQASQIADFDSAIPRFESWRPSQILSHKIKGVEVTRRRAEAIFMLRLVAKISMCFQGSPICTGDSTQHERNMKSEMRLAPKRESTNQLPNGCYGEF
jgi:hypothetical protein